MKNILSHLHSLAPAKILIVDDEADILTVMKKALDGYNVVALSDPKAAYNAIKNNPKECDILVTDVRMPGMSGFQLIREAKRLNRDIKVILMTSFEVHIQELRKTLPSLEIDIVLPKPFHLPKLKSIVDQLAVGVRGDGP